MKKMNHIAAQKIITKMASEEQEEVLKEYHDEYLQRIGNVIAPESKSAEIKIHNNFDGQYYNWAKKTEGGTNGFDSHEYIKKLYMLADFLEYERRSRTSASMAQHSTSTMLLKFLSELPGLKDKIRS
jgi:hypothetical protein